MANFNLKSTGTWFWFDDEEKNGGVCIRELPIAESNRIEKATTTYRRKFKRNQWIEDNKVNTLEASRLTWDYIIMDWKNVIVSGSPLKCNRDNKYKMMMESVSFAKFVLNAGEELSEKNIVDVETKVKNLGNSSSGDSTKAPVKTA